MDNIYVLNFVINKQIERKKGELVALFIRGELVKRVKEVLWETRSRVRGVRDEVGNSFWIRRE